MNRMQKLRALSALALTSAVTGGALAQVDPTTAQGAFEQAATASTGFGPGMYLLAAGSVAILIGVKWIKRARGAA